MGTLLRTAAITAAFFVALSFLLFAVDQSEEGSANQVEAVDGSSGRTGSESEVDAPAPGREVEDLREARHTGLREVIDDGNDLLVAPFTGVVGSSDIWVERLVPAALALVLYGLGGMLLANFVPRRRRRRTDWRHAAG
ncbi:MAG TPA: hypothetical protein VGV10_00155 [Thermoleophilaceae bacterium]|nr:hypothetical protein [Thermoleophilaceae bacterium]